MRCGENTEEISSLIWHPQLLKLQQNAGNLPSKMPRHWSDGVAHFREVPLEFSLTVEVGARALLDIGEKRGSVRRGGGNTSVSFGPGKKGQSLAHRRPQRSDGLVEIVQFRVGPHVLAARPLSTVNPQEK